MASNGNADMLASPRGILKHMDSSSRLRKSITWDEEIIAEHDKDRGTRQKIDEPKTPYTSYETSEVEADGEDFEIEYGQDMGHFSPHSPPEPDRTHEDLEQNWNELQKKLQAQGRRVSLASENSENSENSEEEDEQKREFKEKRKHHYNEYQMMLRFRQQHEDQDEDEDEEHDG